MTFKYVIQGHLVHSWCYGTTATIHFENVFSIPKLHLINNNCPFPLILNAW